MSFDHLGRVQQPVFASNNSNNQGTFTEDFDLNEIFADYFIDEFSSLNPAPAPIAAPSLNHPAATTSLPTGRGIQTPYHVNTNVTSVPNNTITSKAQVDPVFKKQKYVHENVPQSSSALTGRLGFTMGGQVFQNTSSTVVGVSNSQLPRLRDPMESMNKNGQNVVNLPVGVGVRVPTAVKNQVKVASVMAKSSAVKHDSNSGGIQHSQWGKGGITLATHNPMEVMNPTAVAGLYFPSGATGLPQGVDLAKFASAAATMNINSADHAMAERRQRNREHAKRSRIRKKFMLESLQEDVRKLQRENTELRMIIQDKLPNVSQKIFDECCVSSSLFKDEKVLGGQVNADDNLLRSDFSLIQSLATSQQNFVLSDPRLPDNPIVYASQGFYDLTGYSREQVLGRNCRFLQGPGTDPKHIDMIRNAVAKGNDFSICVLNYKADGTPFWNQLFVAALRDNENCIVNFIGVQCAVETERESTLLEDKVNSVLPLAMKDDAACAAEK